MPGHATLGRLINEPGPGMHYIIRAVCICALSQILGRPSSTAHPLHPCHTYFCLPPTITFLFFLLLHRKGKKSIGEDPSVRPSSDDDDDSADIPRWINRCSRHRLFPKFLRVPSAGRGEPRCVLLSFFFSSDEKPTIGVEHRGCPGPLPCLLITIPMRSSLPTSWPISTDSLSNSVMAPIPQYRARIASAQTSSVSTKKCGGDRSSRTGGDRRTRTASPPTQSCRP